jgi:peptidoglycan-associated lipoprotein
MFALLALVLCLGLGAGCAGMKKKSDSDSAAAGDVNTEDLEGSAKHADMVGHSSDQGNAMNLETINFPFDSFRLTSEARNTLKENAEILKNNPEMTIQIEGHCDSRGGIQYNLALGEMRAKAVKQYLVDMGIESSRITIISLGKERLLDPGTSEAAHARNRRANFVITG